jgi:hypothetical protein
MTRLTIEQKISRARTQLLLNQPFFGTLCLRLKLVPMPSFPTMATDGRRLAYNPAFVEKLTPAELEGVLAHEVMHCALAHHCRRGDRDAQLWNQAADYAVNPILNGNGITLPKDALIDPTFTDLAAEEIYARLLKQGQDSGKAEFQQQSSAQPATGGGGGNGLGQAPQTRSQETQSPQHQSQQQPDLLGQSSQPVPERPGGFGEVLDAVDEDGEPALQGELSRQMHEWAINAEQALCSAKACGREPAELNARLNKHGSLKTTGEPFCATSSRPPTRRIIGGLRRTAASSRQVCIYHPLSEPAWATL